MTGMPGRSPSASAAAGRSDPSRDPYASAGATGRRAHPGGRERLRRRHRLVGLDRGHGLAGQPQAHRVPRGQQPARPGRRLGILAGEPGHPRQQPVAAGTGPPVLPGERRPHGPRVGVHRRQRRALAHAADGQHLGVREPARQGAHRGRQRRPPVARILLGPPVRPDVRRVACRGPGPAAVRRAPRAPPWPRSSRGPARGPRDASHRARRRPSRASSGTSRPRRRRPRAAGTSAGPRSPARRRPAAIVGAASARGGRARIRRASVEVLRRAATPARGGGATARSSRRPRSGCRAARAAARASRRGGATARSPGSNA